MEFPLDGPGGRDRPRDRPFPRSPDSLGSDAGDRSPQRDTPSPMDELPRRRQIGPDGQDKPGRKFPEHIREQIEKGNQFNRDQNPRYEPYTEIVLDSDKRVDALRVKPGREVLITEIISRKFTQLADIKPETAKRYLSEAQDKYAPGELIKDSLRNRALGLGGLTLRGRLILEVPVQDKPVPEEILRHAARYRITIRDTEGIIHRLRKEK